MRVSRSRKHHSRSRSRKHSRKSHKHSRKCNCKQCDMYNRSNKRHRRSRNKKQNNTLKLNKPSPEIAYANDMSNKMVVDLNKITNKSNDDAAGNIIPGLRNI